MDKWNEVCIVVVVVWLGMVSVVVEVIGVYWVIVNWYIEDLENEFGVKIFFCYVCGYILIEFGSEFFCVVDVMDE